MTTPEFIKALDKMALADARADARERGDVELEQVLTEEISRRADEALDSIELRSSDNPDWETRAIPPVHVATCDSWRSFVAEGAGCSGPTVHGQIGEEAVGLKIDFPAGSTPVAPLLAIAEQLHKLNARLNSLAKVCDRLNQMAIDPSIIIGYIRQAQLITANIEKADAERQSAEFEEQFRTDE